MWSDAGGSIVGADTRGLPAGANYNHTMPLRKARVWMMLALLLVAVTVALCGVWCVTRNAMPFSHTQPRFTAIHKGNIVLMSSIWTGGMSSTGWMYDTFLRGTSSWMPTYVQIGTSYGGTPAFNTNLFAVFIPIWNIALVFAAITALAGGRAWRLRRIAMASGCPKCGYDTRSLAGQERAAVCPECGMVLVGLLATAT